MTAALRVLVRQRDDNYGPYSVEQLNAMLAEGRIAPDNLAWIEGAPEWQHVRSVPGIRLVPPPLPTSAEAPAGERPRAAEESDRLILPAFLLAFFLGIFGVHRFYCGKTGSGLVMFFLTLSVVGSIVSWLWATIDWIVIVCGGFRDHEEKLLRRWT